MPKTGDTERGHAWCDFCGKSAVDMSCAPPAYYDTLVFLEQVGWVHKWCFAAAYRYIKARKEAQEDNS